ncbi:MAG: type III pantothenate kinase [Armatimonadetes bacterium]|nr:type III pantothenate kinase [Armatimonadota bacterium]
MFLAIDVGNTTISIGLYRGESRLGAWRMRTDRDRTGDEHGVLIAQLLALQGYHLADVTGVAVSNVVPPLAPAIREFAERYTGRPAEFVGEALIPSLPNLYAPPGAVGADRLVDAIAVLRRYGAPAVVVDFGTATTFDAISARGEYLGGAIAPGVGISLEALFRTAAHLPRIEIARPARAIGGSTVESMQSGAYYGFVGQVEGIVRRFVAELGPNTRVIATGGLAPLIAPETPVLQHVDLYLTLDGLRILWDEHHSNRSGSGP